MTKTFRVFVWLAWAMIIMEVVTGADTSKLPDVTIKSTALSKADCKATVFSEPHLGGAPHSFDKKSDLHDWQSDFDEQGRKYSQVRSLSLNQRRGDCCLLAFRY